MIWAFLIAVVAIGIELGLILFELREIKGAVGMIAAMIADAMSEDAGLHGADEYLHMLMRKFKGLEE